MPEEATILIVDDEKHTRDGLRLALEDEYEVYTASDKAGALEILKNDAVDVLVTDLRLGADDGMEVIDAALALPGSPLTIMMTAYGSVDTAVEAMKRGAYHFINKPVLIDELEILIKRGLQGRRMETENKNLRRQVEKKFSIGNLIGKSGPMERVFETLEQVAPTRATVLVEGESGTGKELAAHAVHNLSGRPKDKLVIVHCAGFSENLLESELFGHEKNAFTGASERRIGRFELADGGTLFLDEIGEINANTQVKLLRALGERTIERVGGNTPIKIDVRVVAATNKNLAKMVEDGDFREDLYFRLNVVRVVMPPLRSRREDILLLAKAFLKEFAQENGKPVKDLSDEAAAALLRYHWPGNVRELRTAIEHGVVMSNATKITPRHLPESVRECSPAFAAKANSDRSPAAAPAPGEVAPEDLNLDNMERHFIRLALQRAEGNRTEAAKILGISRRTLHRKLNALQEGGEHE